MKKIIQKIVSGVLILLIMQSSIVWGAASGKLGIQNDEVYLRLIELEVTEDREYRMPVFVQSKYQDEVVWICMNVNSYSGKELQPEDSIKNIFIKNVPFAEKVAVKLYEDTNGKWEECLGLCQSRTKFSEVHFQVTIYESPKQMTFSESNHLEYYIMMPSDHTILPLEDAEELYGFEAEIDDNVITVRGADKEIQESSQVFICKDRNDNGIVLEKSLMEIYQTVEPEPTVTLMPTMTPEPTATPTVMPTPTVTPNPTATPTPIVTSEPTATPTVMPTPTVTPEPTETSTATPTSTVTPNPTATPTAIPTTTPTTVPIVTLTTMPTVTPTAMPVPTVTLEPTVTPTPEAKTIAENESDITPTPPFGEFESEETDSPENKHLLEIFSGMRILQMIILLVMLAFACVLLWLMKRLGEFETDKSIHKSSKKDEEDTIEPLNLANCSDEKIMIQAVAANNKGRVRGNNEDNFFLNGIYMHREKMDAGAFVSGSSQEDVQLYAVCDGMGGADCGEEASHKAVKELALLKKDHQKIINPKNLTFVLREISEKINKEATEREQKSGTTIVLFLKIGKDVVLANVGDSRIYRFRNHKLTQMSVDHSKVQRMISMGILTPEQAKKDPSRHVITQYLGMPLDIKVSPYIVTEDMHEKDVYLLCSDGLTDMVEDFQIEEILKGKENLKEAAQELLKTALDNGGRDNVTVMLIRIMKEAEKKKSEEKKKFFYKWIVKTAQILVGVCFFVTLIDLIYFLL